MENQLLDWALKYASNGYPVFPLHSVRNGRCTCGKSECSCIGKHPRTPDGFKSATTDESTIHRWWQTWPDANIGIPTGQVSGIVVVDADGPEGIRVVREKLKPNTATVRTGKGFHYIYKAPAVRVKNQTRHWDEVDLRGDGGYIVAPPSLHSSGKNYEWVVDLIGGTPEELPDWFFQELDAHSKREERPNLFIEDPIIPKHFLDDFSEMIPDGERNSTLFSHAGKLRNLGWSAIDILPVLQEINEKRCVIPLNYNEVKSIAAKIEKYPAGSSAESEAQAAGIEELTDLGNAKRFVKKHGHHTKYCNEMKRWFVWNGYKWEEDKTIAVRRYAADVVKGIYEEQKKVHDKTMREKIFRHAIRSESLRGIDAMIELAKSEQEVSIRLDVFDTNPFLFHVKNGVLNLMNGEFMPSCPDNFNTMAADIEYNSEAQCPQWDRFLNEIMNGNRDLMKYLQKALGYALTGSIEEQIMFILHGTGANGKSTFIDTLMSLFGDYSMQTPTTTLLMKYQSYISNDLARLRGTRFVVATEVNEGQRLDESLIKQLTGGDRIAARFLHREFFEFTPMFKVFLITNHLPTIHGTDKAIWRRIRKIPFEVTIPDDKIDKHLKEKLISEASGILKWALEGCRLWREEKMNSPKEIIYATEEYRDEMDVIERFIRERCIVGKGLRELSGRMNEKLTEWLQRNGEPNITSVILARKMKEKGYNKHKTNEGNYFLGIRLKTDEDFTPIIDLHVDQIED